MYLSFPSISFNRAYRFRFKYSKTPYTLLNMYEIKNFSHFGQFSYQKEQKQKRTVINDPLDNYFKIPDNTQSKQNHPISVPSHYFHPSLNTSIPVELVNHTQTTRPADYEHIAPDFLNSRHMGSYLLSALMFDNIAYIVWSFPCLF